MDGRLVPYSFFGIVDDDADEPAGLAPRRQSAVEWLRDSGWLAQCSAFDDDAEGCDDDHEPRESPVRPDEEEGGRVVEDCWWRWPLLATKRNPLSKMAA